jgi:hypothetical protein
MRGKTIGEWPRDGREVDEGKMILFGIVHFALKLRF